MIDQKLLGRIRKPGDYIGAILQLVGGANKLGSKALQALGRVWLADAKNGFLRKRPFPNVSKRSTVAPVNLVFGNDPTVFKRRSPTVEIDRF